MKEAPVCCISSTTVPVSTARYRFTWYVCQLGGEEVDAASAEEWFIFSASKISYSSIFNWSSTSLLQSMKFSVVQIFFNQAEKFGGVKSENKLGLFESWNGGWFCWLVCRQHWTKTTEHNSARLQQNLEEGCVPAQKRPHSLLVQIRADCYSLSLTLWECVFQHLC